MEPIYVRRFPLTIPYSRSRKRSNILKRGTYRRVYEEILQGHIATPFEGKVIRAARQQDSFSFYLFHHKIATIKVIGGHFQPSITFHNVEYNRFRLFLRNIGINATGRKNITNIVMPNGTMFRFDHLEGGRLLHPPIPFITHAAQAPTYQDVVQQRWNNLNRENREQEVPELRAATDRIIAGLAREGPTRRMFNPANIRPQPQPPYPITTRQIWDEL